MISTVYTVGTTPVLVVPADDTHRVIILHSGTGSVYIGGSGVTASTGVHMSNGTTLSVTVPSRQTLYAVTSSSTQTFTTLTPDLD